MLKKVFFLFLLASTFAGAQNIDSTNVGFVTYSNSTLQFLDTNLSLESYLDFTDYGQDDFGIISMGSQGDVRRSLFLNSDFSIRPNLGISGYFKNYKAVNEIPFYNVKVPTGGVRFLKGYDKGQMFGGFFTVNPIARLNVFVDYSRINSRGNYFNQENKADHFQFSSRYSTKKDIYKVSAAMTFNSFNNYEFGGMADVSDFEENKLSNRELIPVNLQNSFSAVRAFETRIDQSLRIAKIDSTSEIRLFYDLMASNQYVSFLSSDSIFTQNAIFDDSPIRDSISNKRISNVSGISYILGKNIFTAGINYSYYQYGNEYQLLSEGILGYKLSVAGIYNRFNYSATFDNNLTMNYSGSYDAKVSATLISKDRNWRFGARLNNGLFNPGLFSQRYISNNFNWNNDAFRQILLSSAKGEVWFNNLGLAAEFKSINNYVYFNQKATPEQFIGIVNALNIDLNARFKLAKGFYLDNRVRYQAADNLKIIRIPNWIYRGILFYEFSAFKNALKMHFGTEFNYFSSFTSEAYMPATTVMYLQDETEIGNFPYFNFFVDFKIDEFLFFVRLENLTQGLFEYNYYAAPNYALPDFAFRFGATWRFFN